MVVFTCPLTLALNTQLGIAKGVNWEFDLAFRKASHLLFDFAFMNELMMHTVNTKKQWLTGQRMGFYVYLFQSRSTFYPKCRNIFTVKRM